MVNSEIRPVALLLSAGQAIRNPRHPLQLLDGLAQTVHRPALAPSTWRELRQRRDFGFSDHPLVNAGT